MKKLILIFGLLLLISCGIKDPNIYINAEFARLDARLHSLVGQRRKVVVETIGVPNVETQNEMIYEIGNFIATLDIDRDLLKKYHLQFGK